mgnify:CR=1 FL=1
MAKVKILLKHPKKAALFGNLDLFVLKIIWKNLLILMLHLFVIWHMFGENLVKKIKMWLQKRVLDANLLSDSFLLQQIL